MHVHFFFFLKILFFYLTETASERGITSRGSGRGRSRLSAEEPDVGLDPRTLGSRPEPNQTPNNCATQAPHAHARLKVKSCFRQLEAIVILF